MQIRQNTQQNNYSPNFSAIKILKLGHREDNRAFRIIKEEAQKLGKELPTFKLTDHDGKKPQEWAFFVTGTDIAPFKAAHSEYLEKRGLEVAEKLEKHGEQVEKYQKDNGVIVNFFRRLSMKKPELNPYRVKIEGLKTNFFEIFDKHFVGQIADDIKAGKKGVPSDDAPLPSDRLQQQETFLDKYPVIKAAKARFFNYETLEIDPNYNP